MVSPDEKRRLIADYGGPMRPRAIVAKALAGLLIVAVIAAIGASYPERDETRVARGTVKSGTKSDNAKPAAGGVTGKQAATGR